MNAPTTELRLAKDDFVRWMQRQEGRHEWTNGRVVMMTGGSRAHAVLIGRLVTTLSNQLDPEAWHVRPCDFAIDLETSWRYPDVVVEPAGGDASALRADEPVLVAEVLSPSTENTDLIVKPTEYFALPSLMAYVVVAQDRCNVRLWERDVATNAFPNSPIELAERSACATLRHLGISLNLDDLYRGLKLANATLPHG